MFCFQLAFGRWKTGLAKSACYAKCVPIWSDWILQKMSRYSAKAAQNTLQWEALVEWRGAIVLPFAFAEPFTKQFRTSHKKICVGPGPPSRLCRFDVSWQLVQDDGCQYFWLEGMLTIWLVQSDMEGQRAEENRVQLILIRDDGDNWLITGSERKDQQFWGKISSQLVLGNASGVCSSHSSGASSYPQLFRFHGSLFWQPFMQTRNYQRIKDDFMTGEM